MSQAEIVEQRQIVLSTLTAIQQYPDYESPSGEDEYDLENTRMYALVDYLDADFNNLKDLLGPGRSDDNPVSREELEGVLTRQQLNEIQEILQRNRDEDDDEHDDTSDDDSDDSQSINSDEEHNQMQGGRRRRKTRENIKNTCKRGTIRRRAYTRKDGARVKSACIKDMGKPGKGKKLFTLKKGDLTKHGYSIKVGKERRQRALRKAKKHIPHTTLIRKLNALAILFKNTKPHYAKRAKVDMEYLRNIRKKTQKKRR